MTATQQLAHDARSVADLATKHGLDVVEDKVELNNIGLDFLVAFAPARDGTNWVLRIPRRPDVIEKSWLETRILGLVKRHLPVEVPDWRIHTAELIAYPRLAGVPGLVVDEGKPVWQLDQKSPNFASSFGKALAALHGIDHEEARAAGLTVLTPSEVRRKLNDDMNKVKTEIGVSEALWTRWQAWLADDSYWPQHSALIHGDLYAAHVLVDKENNATGILDWTEAKVADPVTDFMFHQMSFGEEGLKQLLTEYEKAGGRTWPRLADHAAEMLSSFAVNYGLYALMTGNEEHLKAAKIGLGLEPPKS